LLHSVGIGWTITGREDSTCEVHLFNINTPQSWKRLTSSSRAELDGLSLEDVQDMKQVTSMVSTRSKIPWSIYTDRLYYSI
jgi:hypothetical protein